jgi:hypothetical protein
MMHNVVKILVPYVISSNIGITKLGWNLRNSSLPFKSQIKLFDFFLSSRQIEHGELLAGAVDCGVHI